MRSRSSAPGRNGARLLPLLAAALLAPSGAASQVVAEPILAGQAFLADTALTSGTVVLHHLSPEVQGEIDSVSVAPDGSFVFRLPSVPNEAAQEMYFASVRHDGVMYFGAEIVRPVDLDSIYVIHAYDTLVVPAEGVPVALEARSLIFEPNGADWAVTDVFQIRNDQNRTLVPSQGGRVWSYPLPPGAREVAAMNEMAEDLFVREGDDIVVRAALQPGPRLFVLRYFVDSLSVAVPTPGETEMLDVLVREPAPSVAVEGLVQEQSFQLDASTTYRRFAGQGVSQPTVRITPVEEAAPPPVEWIAVLLAVILLGGGLLALRGSRQPRTVAASAVDREGLLLELARLDEAYEGEASPSPARTKEYRRRRAELMVRLQARP